MQSVLELANSWLPGDLPFLTDEQLATVRTLFNDVDFDEDGNIDEDEMTPFLEFIADEFLGGHEDIDIAEMFRHIDASGDGTLQWPEFLWFLIFFKRLFLEKNQAREAPRGPRLWRDAALDVGQKGGCAGSRRVLERREGVR